MFLEALSRLVGLEREPADECEHGECEERGRRDDHDEHEAQRGQRG